MIRGDGGGHGSSPRKPRASGDDLTIFVNPLQFAAEEEYTLPDCEGYGIGGARVYLDVATGLTADVEASVEGSPAHIDYLDGIERSAHLMNATE